MPTLLGESSARLPAAALPAAAQHTSTAARDDLLRAAGVLAVGRAEGPVAALNGRAALLLLRQRTPLPTGAPQPPAASAPPASACISLCFTTVRRGVVDQWMLLGLMDAN